MEFTRNSQQVPANCHIARLHSLTTEINSTNYSLTLSSASSGDRAVCAAAQHEHTPLTEPHCSQPNYAALINNINNAVFPSGIVVIS